MTGARHGARHGARKKWLNSRELSNLWCLFRVSFCGVSLVGRAYTERGAARPALRHACDENMREAEQAAYRAVANRSWTRPWRVSSREQVARTGPGPNPLRRGLTGSAATHAGVGAPRATPPAYLKYAPLARTRINLYIRKWLTRISAVVLVAAVDGRLSRSTTSSSQQRAPQKPLSYDYVLS